MNSRMSENNGIFSTVYKYVLLMCNCRRDFEPLQTEVSPRNQDFHSHNGNVITSDLSGVFAKVDKYLDGDDHDREKAYNLLVENLTQVCKMT